MDSLAQCGSETQVQFLELEHTNYDRFATDKSCLLKLIDKETWSAILSSEVILIYLI